VSQFFFSLYVFGEQAVHFSSFSPLSPLTEVSPQPNAIPGGNPPEDWQSAVEMLESNPGLKDNSQASRRY
jgi:hypothetical protein